MNLSYVMGREREGSHLFQCILNTYSDVDM
jgi:hypothetical protein